MIAYKCRTSFFRHAPWYGSTGSRAMVSSACVGVQAVQAVRGRHVRLRLPGRELGRGCVQRMPTLLLRLRYART